MRAVVEADYSRVERYFRTHRSQFATAPEVELSLLCVPLGSNPVATMATLERFAASTTLDSQNNNPETTPGAESRRRDTHCSMKEWRVFARDTGFSPRTLERQSLAEVSKRSRRLAHLVAPRFQGEITPMTPLGWRIV